MQQNEFFIGYVFENVFEPVHITLLEYDREPFPIKDVVKWQIIVIRQDHCKDRPHHPRYLENSTEDVRGEKDKMLPSLTKDGRKYLITIGKKVKPYQECIHNELSLLFEHC